jgi:hypothetical protein
MAVNLSPYGGVGAQFLDNAGNVLTGGKIETYAAGTTTPQAVYTTSAGNIFHTNPIILDASGRVPSGGEIWLTDGLLYKFVLRDSNNVLIATYDNISGINSNFVNFTSEQEIQTATAGQTVFTLTTVNYTPGTNSLSVFVDGVNQYGPGAQYAYLETNSTTVTFVNGLHVGASVKFTTAAALTGTATNANVVIYNPAGVNAVSTTVQAKLRETISVIDFGAVGNGVTDDTVAIQNAIDYCVANQKGVIFIPAGTYNITAPIRLYTNISLVGEGSGTSVISKSTNTNGTGSNTARGGTITDSYVYDDIIQLIHADNQYTYDVNIRGLRLIKTAYAANSHGIYYPRAAYLNVEDVHIINTQHGTFTYDSFVVNFNSVQTQANQYGFSYEDDGAGLNSGTTATFQNCAVNFDATVAQPINGFNLNLLTYSNIISSGVDNGNRVDGGVATAYFLQSCNSIVVTGCGVENHTGRAIYLGSGSATFTGLRTISVKGSTTPNAATVTAETSSALTLINCNFETLILPSTQYNWQIQTGANVLEVNPLRSPNGGDTFISFSGGASLNTISPSSPFSAAAFRTLFQGGQTFTNGVPFTIFTITSVGTWIVNAYVPNSGANYQSSYIVVSDGVTATATALKAGANLPISLSGLDVVVTVSGGSTTGGIYSVLKIG